MIRLICAAGGCFKAIMGNFFVLQYWAALHPGQIPVSSVDHPLDAAIPFVPRLVGVYLSFVAYWLRLVWRLLRTYGRRGIPFATDFIVSMGRVYDAAGHVYRQHLSTTNRPRYLKSPRFILIHAADPHLMCIPSLHVMVVVRGYTAYRAAVGALDGNTAPGTPGAGENTPTLCAARRGALAIIEAILYVKQHSVNCVAAAFYAMTRFDPDLFPPEEATAWGEALFTGPGPVAPAEGARIREHIHTLYRRFLAEGADALPAAWDAPLIAFLRAQPPWTPPRSRT